MKGIVALITVLAGLSMIGLSLRDVPQYVAATDPLYFDFNSAQALLGGVVALAGLVTLKRSER